MKILGLLVGLVAVWWLWSRDKAARPIPESMPEEAVWLDVRTPAEYASGHVEGALNLPFDQIHPGHPIFASGQLTPDTPVWVYCRSGRRSAIAQPALEKLGFTVTDVGSLSRARSLTRH